MQLRPIKWTAKCTAETNNQLEIQSRNGHFRQLELRRVPLSTLTPAPSNPLDIIGQAEKKHSFVKKRYLTKNNSNCSASARQLKEDKRKYNVHMNCFLIVANEVCTATHSTSDTTNGPMF